MLKYIIIRGRSWQTLKKEDELKPQFKTKTKFVEISVLFF
jgi:hypothetical protein